MNISYLTLFAVLLKCISCSDAPAEHQLVLSDELAMVSVKEEIRRVVETNTVEKFPHERHPHSIHLALISLAEEGFVSVVGSFLTKIYRLQVTNNSVTRWQVILRTNIKATAELLQLDCFRNSQIKYEVFRRDDAGALMAYLRANTDVLDGDRLKIWLQEVALKSLHDHTYLTHLAIHADYDTLKAARDELLSDDRCKKLSLDDARVLSMLLLSAMSRVIKRKKLLATLFVTEQNILPQALVEIINEYITADE